jgi:hypothetical protein
MNSQDKMTLYNFADLYQNRIGEVFNDYTQTLRKYVSERK